MSSLTVLIIVVIAVLAIGIPAGLRTSYNDGRLRRVVKPPKQKGSVSDVAPQNDGSTSSSGSDQAELVLASAAMTPWDKASDLTPGRWYITRKGDAYLRITRGSVTDFFIERMTERNFRAQRMSGMVQIEVITVSNVTAVVEIRVATVPIGMEHGDYIIASELPIILGQSCGHMVQGEVARLLIQLSDPRESVI